MAKQQADNKQAMQALAAALLSDAGIRDGLERAASCHLAMRAIDAGVTVNDRDVRGLAAKDEGVRHLMNQACAAVLLGCVMSCAKSASA